MKQKKKQGPELMVKLSINLILNHPTVKSLQTPQLKIIFLKKEKQ